jgi:conjugal transfer pilus assembly protein TraF
MRSNSMGKYLLIILCLFYSATAIARDYYSQHETGWYWFDEPTKKTSVQPPVDQSKVNDPTESVNSIRKTIKRSLDQAIIDPTPENVEKYIALQNQMSERANKFSNTWQKVLLNHPELNYSITHPTNNVALQVYHENESKEKISALTQFSQRSGLFFFYRSTCQYCQRFAPILKHFAEVHHIVVVPITMDGVSLPEFPDSRQDSGQAAKFQVSVEPSLYAVDPKTHKAFPVAFGLTSETELLDNIYKIMTNFQEGIA